MQRSTLPALGLALRRHGVALAVAVGLVVRIAITTALFDWGQVPTRWDDASYAHYAKVLLDTGSLESHHFPIGYPVFVALLLKVSGGSFAAVRAANVLLGTLTVWVVSRIGRILFGEPAALSAAWITALCPTLVFMTGRVMSETLFIALLLLSLLAFIEGDRDADPRRTALAGALFGTASIVRSNLLLMIPLLPVWILLRARMPLRRRVTAVVLCLACTGAVLAIPGTYFLVSRGEFIPFATNAGATFYGANNALSDGNWIQVEDHPELLRSIPADVRRQPQAYSRAQYALALRWIRDNPGAFLELLPRKFANAWIPGLEKSVTTSGSWGASLLFFLWQFALVAGAVVGRATTRPLQRDGLLLAVLVVYTVMSLAFYGNPRIGLFCTPILIVYSAVVLARLPVLAGRTAQAVGGL